MKKEDSQIILYHSGADNNYHRDTEVTECNFNFIAGR